MSESLVYLILMDEPKLNRREVELYIENAEQMLQVAEVNLRNDFYASAVNRAYYAIFYAANALLATKGESRSKHSGVVSRFRELYVKSGEFSKELSQIYGDVMERRHIGDYELQNSVEKEDAQNDIKKC